MRPYQPCNGTEGEFFCEEFCEKCVKDRAVNNGGRDPKWEDGCQILARAFAYDKDDPKYPAEWIADDDGNNPRCTAYVPDVGQVYPDPALLTDEERKAQLPLL